ncbi:MAG: 5-(carboxyamino)imidazole ribonucleotide synthase [Candidatus Deianiraeaceae bacterium]|jgi:5-(carboxyamino)imidazole ribonucleotide synthase
MFNEGTTPITVGILGGGQLAQMMAMAASKLGFETSIYCEEVNPCAKNMVSNVVTAPFLHFEKLRQFASKCDFITIETENIPLDAIRFLEKHFPDQIKTGSSFVKISQDRIREKEFASALDIATGEYIKVNSVEDMKAFFNQHGSCILKTTTEGYDGKGHVIINKINDIPTLSSEKKYILEKKVNFAFECSVIATKKGQEVAVFPIPLNIHKGGILRESTIPMNIKSFTSQKISSVKNKVKNYTQKIAENISHNGTFAVEYFVLASGEVIFNEMAPRPHNSGHFSNDLCNVSQFENHIRAVVDMPLLEPTLVRSGKMLNIIGDDINGIEKFLDKPNHKIHLYCKSFACERKLGHINIIE